MAEALDHVEPPLPGWREHTVSWRATNLVYCDLCGRLLPRRAWTAVVEGELRRFCEPDCETLYRDYWLPRHAASRG
jgi:hypothetical protein